MIKHLDSVHTHKHIFIFIHLEMDDLKAQELLEPY